ncbi:pilus assembly protein [Aquimonas voraii]|uniref:Type IV pilus assembly protein PilY1 n=1 Tax=Aquimonas voraii TaxID=265719 RepID=A0A1G6S145_9GAMM|nr:PilC/PilY family type IV pilus protein [Aquimonas voraii]SDD10642.1 type IV pilus assembly protein PilY1 [Aquimonas voraii]
MSKLRIHPGLQSAALVLCAGLSAPAQAQFNVAQYPLYVQQPVKPAFIMAVDDSGSMTFETLFPQVRDGYACWDDDTADTNAFYDSDGNLRRTGNCNFHHLIPTPGHRIGTNRYAIPPLDQFGFARSPQINPAYYDPGTEYRPWKNGDGSEFPQASVTDTRVNPRFATPRLNVSATHLDRTDPEGEDGAFNDSGAATYGIGTLFPAGVWVARNGACGGLPNTGGTFQLLTSDVVLTAGCNNVSLRRARTGTPAADERFRVPTGTVLPAGTTYFRDADSACGGLALARPSQRTWVRLAAPHTMTATCDIGMQYLPATYYLSVDTPAPEGFIEGNRVLAANACGAGCNMYRYEIRPENYQTAAGYQQQIQNFANWFSFYGNRNRSMIAGMTRALADISFLRVGFFTINNRVDVTMNDLEIQSARDNLYDNSLLTLPANGSTPNRQAVQHLGNQFRRAPAAKDAVNPPQPILNEANGGACQVNGGMLFTDGYSNQDGPTVGNRDGSLGFPFADTHSDTLADIASFYYENSLQPTNIVNQSGIQVPAACAAGTAEPWVDCKTFPHMNFFGVTLGATGEAYGITHALPPNDWTEGYTNPPAWPSRQNDNPTAVDDIWHAAINTRGRFINATTPEQITQAMRDVLLDVTSRARPAGGVAASGSRTGDGFLVYVPEFYSDDWTGDLKAYRLNDGGTLVTPPEWSMAEELESVNPASRTIYVNVDGSLQPFTQSGLGGAATAQSRLGITAADLSAYGGATVEQVINYLRGDRTLEASNGGTLRSRRYKVGDILNSQPELTVAASFGYTRLSPAEGGGSSGSGSYGQYLRDKRGKVPVLFVGSNDGMLHALDSRPSGGNVLFSIVPNSVLTSLKELPKKNYQHRYFVDGSPVQADVRIGSTWRTILLSSNGAGGKSIMALDVTNAATSFSPNSDFLWEFQNTNLGHVLNPPRAALLEGGNWVVVTGNGVNSGDHRSRLFVLNAATGAIITQLAVGSGSATAPNGLTSAVPVDTDFNGKADAIYGGDMQGNLWKFNVSASGSITVANGGSPLFVATDASGNRQPISGSLDVALHHIQGQMVLFGTGQYFEVGDNLADASAQVQSFYGVWDKNDGSSATRSQLQPQVLGQVALANGGQGRTISDNPVNWDTQRGFLIDLRIPGGGPNTLGERAIGRPRVQLGNVLFTSYRPVGDICNPGGDNWVYVVNLLTGNGELDFPGCGEDCAAVRIVSGGNPVLSPPAAVRPGAEGNPVNPRQEDPEGNLIDPAPTAGCRNDVGIILGDGFVRLKQIDCGRQAWRQLQ